MQLLTFHRSSQRFHDALTGAIAVAVGVSVFLYFQDYGDDNARLRQQRIAAFDLDIQFMTDGANRIKDNFAHYVAGVTEVITQGVPPDPMIRKDILAASSVLREEMAMLSEYDTDLKVSGDVVLQHIEMLNSDMHTYSRRELRKYEKQLAQIERHYQDYILEVYAVAKSRLRSPAVASGW